MDSPRQETEQKKHVDESSKYENVSKRIEQWNRAIPEAGYIRLGTIRYGVKLANPKPISCTSSIDEKLIDPTMSTTETVYNDSCSSSRSNGSDNCCCIGTKDIIMPWNSNYVRSRLPVPANLMAKNRTLSSSSSSITTQRTSQAISGSLVIENRESSPPTCCYSSPTKNSNIFYSIKQNKLESNSTIVHRNSNRCDSSKNVFTYSDEAFVAKNYIKAKCEHKNLTNKNLKESDIKSSSKIADPVVKCVSDIKINNSTNKNGTVANVDAKNNVTNNNDKLKSLKCYSPCSPIDEKKVLSCHADVSDQSNEQIGQYGHVNKYTIYSNKSPIVRKLTPKLTTNTHNQNNCFHTENRNLRSTTENKHPKDDIDATIEYSDDDFSFIDSSAVNFSSASDLRCSSLKENNSRKIDLNESNFGSTTSETEHCGSQGNRGEIDDCADIRHNITSVNNVANENRSIDCENQIQFIELNKKPYKIPISTSRTISKTSSIHPKNTFNVPAEEEEINFENKSIPLVHNNQPYRRISLDNTPKNSSFFAKSPVYNRLLPVINLSMEKRRNTLDRWQRLGFGKRASSNPPENKNKNEKETKRGSDKTERLKELTELLKGSRAPQIPPIPPVPPPRKPRPLNSQSLDNTLLPASHFKQNKYTNEHTEINHSSSDEPVAETSSGSIFCAPKSIIYKPIKQNTSACSLDHFVIAEEAPNDITGTPPLAEKEDDLFTALPRAESRTIIGAYTQKNIPFRSASFSQIDYSSGKYIRSHLGSIKSTAKETSVVENGNITLPRKRDVSRCQSPNNTTEDSECFVCNITELPSMKTEMNINLDYDGDEEESIIQDELTQDVEEFTRNTLCGDINTIYEHDLAGLTLVQASELELDTPCEEELPISSSSNQDYLQTATTCLIPVPVYECVAREWNPGGTSEQWINACEEDSDRIIEEFNVNLDMISELNEVDANDDAINIQISDNDISEMIENTICEIKELDSFITDKESVYYCEDSNLQSSSSLKENALSIEIGVISDEINTKRSQTNSPSIEVKELQEVSEIPINEVDVIKRSNTNSPCNVIESPPEISVTPGSSIELDDSKLISDSKENTVGLSAEIVEVRKRHSNDGRSEKYSDNTITSSETLNNTVLNCNGEDRRRVDKSKRRKGIYIQWPAIDKQKTVDHDVWNNSNKNSSSPDEVPSLWECDKTEGETLEHCTEIDLANCDFSAIKSNVEKKLERLTNVNSVWLSCKTPDDSQTSASHSGSFEPTTPESEYNSRQIWPKVGRKQSLTCQSSEEKDEALSAASPSTKSYNKISLLRSESISDNESDRNSPRERTSQSPAPSDQDLKRYSKRPLRGPYGQMLEAEMKKPAKLHYDEILEELNRAESPSKYKELSAQSFDDTSHLPVPCHTRASSTPIRTDTSPKDLTYNHRRFPSSVDSTNVKKDLKKLYLEGIKDRSPKKTSLHDEQISKKAVTGDSEKIHKRSLDETRLSQSNRTKSEKSLMVQTLETPRVQLQATPELLAELLKGSSEKLVSEQLQLSQRGGTSALPTAVLKYLDTRTHVVVELFNTEQSYVESLETVVLKYLNPLKSAENSGIVDVQIVDEIFLMVPSILNVHEQFLDELRHRLNAWEPQQRVGDAFVEVFSKSTVLDTYTSFVNNWNKAKDAIRATRATRPAFARFLETMAREHKGKLSLDNLLIKPVQKFPNYELILSRLIKHTDIDHPDQKPLQEALKLVHDILLHLNCKEREALENDHREGSLRELEGVIEGISDLVTSDRQFLLFDLVSMPSGQVGRKDRGFFLFSDLLVITSIKRRSGTIRKPNPTCPGSVAATLDTNKYKFLMKISVDDLEIVKAKDENLRKIIKDIEHLSEDYSKLKQILDITSSLRCQHQSLEDSIKDLQRDVQRQLSDRQTNDSQLSLLELTLNTTNGVQHMSVVFTKSEKKIIWEQAFMEAKQKLGATMERHPAPEFLTSIPIRKTRAGLQFTCAAPTLGHQKDVWVCNSDGYVGQVCVLSLIPEPTVTSCNGVCNARILCVASVPANIETSNTSRAISISVEDTSTQVQTNNHISSEIEKQTYIKPNSGNIQLDSSSSSDDSDNENIERVSSTFPKTPRQHSEANFDDLDSQQSTMWLGTEDGCIHVYNCTDNIRIKKNKIKIQHVSAVYSILYLDNRVFVALSNGELIVYWREQSGWNTASPLTISIGTVTSPITRLLNVHGKLWCSIQGVIKILNSATLQIENQIQISSDAKPITNMALSTNFVWIAVQNSAYIKCFHSNNYDLLFEVNLAPPVNKMLSNCDDIIRQHKAACLRVTSLLACKELVWIGTSAGVLLTISAMQTAMDNIAAPIVTGIPYGHTGHVRFLTCVDYDKSEEAAKANTNWHSLPIKTKADTSNVLIISGGDGYEDFRNSGINPLSEVAGREDSTNHLLLWQV